MVQVSAQLISLNSDKKLDDKFSLPEAGHAQKQETHEALWRIWTRSYHPATKPMPVAMDQE